MARGLELEGALAGALGAGRETRGQNPPTGGGQGKDRKARERIGRRKSMTRKEKKAHTEEKQGRGADRQTATAGPTTETGEQQSTQD